MFFEQEALVQSLSWQGKNVIDKFSKDSYIQRSDTARIRGVTEP